MLPAAESRLPGTYPKYEGDKDAKKDDQQVLLILKILCKHKADLISRNFLINGITAKVTQLLQCLGIKVAVCFI